MSLPVYRCARGSTSLHSFHLHLHRFIPGEAPCSKSSTLSLPGCKILTVVCHVAGSSARGTFFQVFLLEGLTRWNEDRGKAAAGAEGAGTSCYSGQEQHTLHQLTQHFFQTTLVESYVKPLQYTGDTSDSEPMLLEGPRLKCTAACVSVWGFTCLRHQNKVKNN